MHSEESESSNRKNLSRRMREEWNRRMEYDYRFWTSDGITDDTAMWKTGERDLQLLLQELDISKLKACIGLDLGCGVGRLLRPAAKLFKSVIGVDVSTSALTKAKTFLGELSNLKLVEGDGLSLTNVPDESIDIVWSFGTFGSLPVSVTANYLLEISRVLKIGGIARLQVYLGKTQETFKEDTVALRSYERERFIAAVSEVGFKLEWSRELKLPFFISDAKVGRVVETVSLQKISSPWLSSSEVESILVPTKEPSAEATWQGSETEFLMYLARAQQQLADRNVLEAENSLDLARKSFIPKTRDLTELLERVRAEIAKSQTAVNELPQAFSDDYSKKLQPSLQNKPKVNQYLVDSFSAELYSRNIKVIEDRFPSYAKSIEQAIIPDKIEIVRGDSGLATIIVAGVPLDNIYNPQKASARFAEQAIKSSHVDLGGEIIICGFALGYHVDELLNITSIPIMVYEPNPWIVKVALGIKDCRSIFQRITKLIGHPSEVENLLIDESKILKTTVINHPQSQVLFRKDLEKFTTAFWSKRGFLELHPSVAVVGPLYGGSLPIAGYTERALRNLGQRATGYDVSGFYSGFKKMGDFVRDVGGKSSLESKYVELMSDIVLQSVNERPIDILICLAQAPISPRVLTELRNRGVITAMWFVEDCRRFTSWQSISRYFDYMFLIQKNEFPAQVEAAGAGRALYLPVACDPNIHIPMTLSEEERKRWGSSVSFVGAGYHNRQQVFATLADRDFKIWGSEWPAVAPFLKLVQEQSRRISPEEYVRIFNASTINLNLHSSSERDGVEPNGDFINPRTFELAACGAFQLVDTRLPLGEMFEVGKEIVTFSDTKDLEDKIDYYLASKEERDSVCQAGRLRVLKEHTYEHRLKEMLGAIYADRFKELKDKAVNSPWAKTLEASKEVPELEQRFSKAFAKGFEPTLDSLVADIQLGKGKLSEADKILLFLHHVRKQVTTVNDLRQGK